jgi:hypothetical protein
METEFVSSTVFTLDDLSAMTIQRDRCKSASTDKTYHEGHPKEQQRHVLFLQLLADNCEVIHPCYDYNTTNTCP